MAKVIYDAQAIENALDRIAESLCAHTADGPFALVGIRRGGEFLAQRLVKAFAARTGFNPPLGVVDITLYRDDGFGPHAWPTVGVTRIPFDLPSHTVVLVDDVLYTGRTVRAAIDAILDYGRPKAVRLAVLVDRGLRELPIRADAAGYVITTTPTDHIDVHLTEGGAPADAVTMKTTLRGASQ